MKIEEYERIPITMFVIAVLITAAGSYTIHLILERETLDKQREAVKIEMSKENASWPKWVGRLEQEADMLK